MLSKIIQIPEQIARVINCGDKVMLEDDYLTTLYYMFLESKLYIVIIDNFVSMIFVAAKKLDSKLVDKLVNTILNPKTRKEFEQKILDFYAESCKVDKPINIAAYILNKIEGYYSRRG